jgi:hypothetical protein
MHVTTCIFISVITKTNYDNNYYAKECLKVTVTTKRICPVAFHMPDTTERGLIFQIAFN